MINNLLEMAKILGAAALVLVLAIVVVGLIAVLGITLQSVIENTIGRKKK